MSLLKRESSRDIGELVSMVKQLHLRLSTATGLTPRKLRYLAFILQNLLAQLFRILMVVINKWLRQLRSRPSDLEVGEEKVSTN